MPLDKSLDHPDILNFSRVTVILSGTTILRDIAARVPRGSWTAVVGPNGAGKTTLLLALLGQLPYQGHIPTFPQNGSSLAIGYVPQRLDFDRNLPLTVLEFMSIGKQRTPIFFGIRKQFKEQAAELLKAVHAENLLRKQLGDLSGGEFQRVLLALALGQNPELLVLDEVAAGVDVSGARVFCELLDELRQERQFTQLSVEHDLSTVSHHATHVICLNQQVIAEGAPEDTLSTETLTKLFGLHMGLVNQNALSGRQGACDGPCCRNCQQKEAGNNA